MGLTRSAPVTDAVEDQGELDIEDVEDESAESGETPDESESVYESAAALRDALEEAGVDCGDFREAFGLAISELNSVTPREWWECGDGDVDISIYDSSADADAAEDTVRRGDELHYVRGDNWLVFGFDGVPIPVDDIAAVTGGTAHTPGRR